jgi:hypothetical protein
MAGFAVTLEAKIPQPESFVCNDSGPKKQVE